MNSLEIFLNSPVGIGFECRRKDHIDTCQSQAYTLPRLTGQSIAELEKSINRITLTMGKVDFIDKGRVSCCLPYF
jgi:hypothetical protein